MEKEFDILTALDICVDFLVDCGDTDAAFGQKERLINGYSFEMGGSACIFACQCAKLGLKTAGIGTVGSDSMGKIVMDGLENAGVNTSLIKKSDKIKTGLGVALNKSNGDRSILTYLGTIDKVETQCLHAQLPKTRHLHICSYFLQKSLQPEYKNIVKKAKQNNITVSLDSNWDPQEKWNSGINEILPYVDVFLPNEIELCSIFGQSDPREALKYAGEIVPTIVVKCGEKGAYAYHQGAIYESPALKTTIADTVGAGDSFNAGFIYAWLSKKELMECLKAGVICGSLSTRKPGGIAGQPNLKKMQSMLSMV